VPVKDFQNRSIFKDVENSIVSCFLTRGVYTDCVRVRRCSIAKKQVRTEI